MENAEFKKMRVWKLNAGMENAGMKKVGMEYAGMENQFISAHYNQRHHSCTTTNSNTAVKSKVLIESDIKHIRPAGHMVLAG